MTSTPLQEQIAIAHSENTEFFDFPGTTGPVEHDVAMNARTNKELDKLTDIERLAVLETEGGFSPRSPRELTLALGAIEHRDTPGGFAKYLNEVLIRQTNKTSAEDPQAALRKIVSDIKGFVGSTRGDQTMISLVEDSFPDGNLEVLASSSSFDDWVHQASTRRGLQLLTFEHRLRSRSDEDPKVDLSLPGDEEIGKLVSTMRVYEAREAVRSLTRQNQARKSFWLDVLRSARSHLVVTTIVDSALKEYDLK